jgi:hypothetical protein
VETGSTYLVCGLLLYIRGTKGYDIITDTGLQYLQSNNDRLNDDPWKDMRVRVRLMFPWVAG